MTPLNKAQYEAKGSVATHGRASIGWPMASKKALNAKNLEALGNHPPGWIAHGYQQREYGN